MLADDIILNLKCQAVIEAYAGKCSVDLRKALDVFYNSALYAEIRAGISDMHCRSDGYLAEELRREINGDAII